jgi:cytosine/adenosine deaminase-related metal-dependent hydrolase
MKRWPLLRAALWTGGFNPPGTSPIKALAEAGFFDRARLVAHGNYLDEVEIEILRRSRSTVVYCPRSHDYFGHRDHPCRRLLAAGAAVALGTDSLASSPSLSLLDEMRFLHRRDPGLPGEVLLAMATSAGADALGRRGETGRLAPGEWADLATVRPPARAANDPWQALFDPQSQVEAVWIQGRRVAGVAA